MRASVVRSIYVILFLALLTSCGFHLVSNDYRLPPDWSRLSVKTGAGVSPYSDLVLSLKQQLRETQGATIRDAGSGVPQIVLSGEKFRTPVSALDSFGRAQEYLLEYIVYYQFVDSSGKPLLPKQRIYLRREQSYSSTQILAKEQESEYLRQELRHRAAERIVNRLLAVLNQQPRKHEG
jgi:LPS-assembly lipoprotein